jgi:hypothetical protein
MVQLSTSRGLHTPLASVARIKIVGPWTHSIPQPLRPSLCAGPGRLWRCDPYSSTTFFPGPRPRPGPDPGGGGARAPGAARRGGRRRPPPPPPPPPGGPRPRPPPPAPPAPPPGAAGRGGRPPPPPRPRGGAGAGAPRHFKHCSLARPRRCAAPGPAPAPPGTLSNPSPTGGDARQRPPLIGHRPATHDWLHRNTRPRPAIGGRRNALTAPPRAPPSARRVARQAGAPSPAAGRARPHPWPPARWPRGPKRAPRRAGATRHTAHCATPSHPPPHPSFCRGPPSRTLPRSVAWPCSARPATARRASRAGQTAPAFLAPAAAPLAPCAAPAARAPTQHHLEPTH